VKEGKEDKGKRGLKRKGNRGGGKGGEK